jgi:hypothetical protein
MTNRKLGVIAAVSVLMTGAAAHAGGNLVTNGGFESITADPHGYASFEIDPAYSPGKLNDWTIVSLGSAGAFDILFSPVGATSVEPDTRYTPPRTHDVQYLWTLPGNPDPNGGNFVALAGDPNANGKLEQTINGLKIGTTYQLKFSWAAAQLADRSGPTTEQLRIGFGDQSAATGIISNTSRGATDWETDTFDFKADSTSALLSFLSVGTVGLPPVALLDGVSVTAVPEPSTWALMVLALGGVGAAARTARRRRAVTV